MSSLVAVGDQVAISPCSDRYMCCGTAENVTSCCASGGAFLWLNATFLSEAQTTAPVSSSPTTTTFTTTAIATVFASNTTAGSTSPSSSTEFSCTSQNVAPGAGLGVPLGLAMITAMVLGFLLYREKRAQHRQSGNQSDGYEARGLPRGRSVKELPGTHGVREMPGSGVPEVA
jgi:hypothetical protein